MHRMGNRVVHQQGSHHQRRRPFYDTHSSRLVAFRVAASAGAEPPCPPPTPRGTVSLTQMFSASTGAVEVRQLYRVSNQARWSRTSVAIRRCGQDSTPTSRQEMAHAGRWDIGRLVRLGIEMPADAGLLTTLMQLPSLVLISLIVSGATLLVLWFYEFHNADKRGKLILAVVTLAFCMTVTLLIHSDDSMFFQYHSGKLTVLIE